MPPRQSAEVLAAANRVLHTALQEGTIESTALACLESAEDLTDSPTGWIGVLNAEKRLDTIAMGAAAWNACAMGEGAAGQLLNMEIRGIWSGVLRDDTALIVNRPGEHRFRVGVPIGHIAVDCFMGVPLRQQGQPFGMIALANKPGGYTSEDIEQVEPLATALATALYRLSVESELKMLRALFESSVNGLAVCDLEGIITRTNPSFAATWGRTRPEEILGWPLDDVVPLGLEDDEGSLRSLLTKRAWRREAIATAPAGHSFPVSVAGGPIYTDSGKLGAYSVTTRDITERKDAETRAWAAAEDLARSNQELERFAQLAARELNEPLRKILAFGEFLEADCGH